MPDEYISREAALTALQDSDLFNTTERQLRAIRELPAPTLRRWCGARTAGTVSMQRGARDMRAAEQLESIITQILDAQTENCEQTELQNERAAVCPWERERRKTDAGLLLYMQEFGIQKELRLPVPMLEAQGGSVLRERPGAHVLFRRGMQRLRRHG